MPSKKNRAIAAAAAAVIALTSVGITPTEVSAAPAKQATVAKADGNAGAIDFSSQKRRHRNDAAVIGGAAAIIGGVAAIAAAKSADRRYRSNYYQPYGYYQPQPYGYAPYYGYRPYALGPPMAGCPGYGPYCVPLR